MLCINMHIHTIAVEERGKKERVRKAQAACLEVAPEIGRILFRLKNDFDANLKESIFTICLEPT